MHRLSIVLLVSLAACAPEAGADIASTRQPLTLDIIRERVSGDVWHWQFLLRVGDEPNARLRIHRVVRERAPFFPRPTTGGVMMTAGDFADFESNFAPSLDVEPSTFTGMATWLAERNIDVWGLDRRGPSAPADADLSDFATMGLEQALGDIGTALAFARGIRLVTDGKVDRLTFIGFSRGGQLGYYYAAREGALPPWQRHLEGLVPLDVFASIAPEDEDIRQTFCAIAASEYQAVADGFVDTGNSFNVEVGALAVSAPDEQTPFQFFWPGYTNREVFMEFLGQTYFFFPPSAHYHLAAPLLQGGVAVDFRDSDYQRLATWLMDAPPFSSQLEAADTDAMACGDSPPVDLSLADIHIPLLAIIAEGGYGTSALHSTTQVGSSDVTVLMISRGRDVFEEFGHADILYGRDAATLAWQPLLAWLRAH